MDEVRAVRGRAPGDQFSTAIDEYLSGKTSVVPAQANHPLDSDEARKEHKMLMQWYLLERERQAANRLEMAMDCDFYDGIQWDPDDAQALKDRGQMPLVYNEMAPMIDWIIGTERRNRVDWKVLPRTEDDVQAADVKTKTLKYVADINRVPFLRSRAFADAAKAGVGWLDDGVRDDPTQDVLYSRCEDWRNVLWDSVGSYELDLSDARYLFRWRWVDEDVAIMMFPDRANQIRQAVEDAGRNPRYELEEEGWYLGEEIHRTEMNGTIYSSGSGVMIDAQRRRIKLIEAQYRKPCRCHVIADGPMKGAFFNPESDYALAQKVAEQQPTIVDRIMMRTHVAVFTEAHMLGLGTSIYRHNRFSLTPIWCYRRGRDRLPYGAGRRVRDIQQDLNKRASKALFMLNTNQIIADDNATDDWENLRDEADRPDGLIVKKKGAELTLRRDTDAATGQIQMMSLDAQSIQKSAGVTDENLGRKTNAVSGEAIKARQLQGSVVTTEPFDNLRYAIQVQGEKQLSLVEQFYTEEKVIRLTGARGKLDWVKINQPELQPDGSVRWINDITASMADFVVSEQDYSGTLRQAMFDAISDMAGRLPPEVGLRLLTIAMEYSDLPNKDEVAQALRAITGDKDPNKELTPEEAAQAEEQLAQQSEALQMQREEVMLALDERRAKVRELNARAAQIEAQAGAGDGVPEEIQRQIMQVQSQAADQIDRLSQQLAKAQLESANRTLQIKADSDTKAEAARIDADAKVRVAEITAASDKQIAALQRRMEDLVGGIEKKLAEKEAMEKAEDAAEKKAEAESKKSEEKEDKTEKAEAPALPPVTINVQVDAASGPTKKAIKIQKDAAGNITGAEVEESRDEGAKKK